MLSGNIRKFQEVELNFFDELGHILIMKMQVTLTQFDHKGQHNLQISY